MRPFENDETIKESWYLSATIGWPEKGPCTPKPGQEKGHFAETIDPQRLIYFCDTVWNGVGGGRLKEDLRKLKNSKIPTGKDGWKLDFQLSPATILLHEMTHQILEAGDDDALGYDFVDVSKGKDNPQAALRNADTYPYFAMAAYLSQLDWHSGKAQEIK